MFFVQIDVGGNFWQIHLGRQGVWSPEDFMDDTSALSSTSRQSELR